jgi:hypothetical protein
MELAIIHVLRSAMMVAIVVFASVVEMISELPASSYPGLLLLAGGRLTASLPVR